jgi:hypothetical protein
MPQPYTLFTYTPYGLQSDIPSAFHIMAPKRNSTIPRRDQWRKDLDTSIDTSIDTEFVFREPLATMGQ